MARLLLRTSNCFDRFAPVAAIIRNRSLDLAPALRRDFRLTNAFLSTSNEAPRNVPMGTSAALNPGDTHMLKLFSVAFAALALSGLGMTQSNAAKTGGCCGAGGCACCGDACSCTDCKCCSAGSCQCEDCSCVDCTCGKCADTGCSCSEGACTTRACCAPATAA